MHAMPDIKDDSRWWPGPEVEDTDPRTEAEKRLWWITEYWGDALVNDTADGWASVRECLLGAAMTLIYSPGRHEDAQMVRDLQDIAFQNQLACIREKK